MEMDVTVSPLQLTAPFFPPRSVILKSHFTKTADFIKTKGGGTALSHVSATSFHIRI